jgi:hypothetical protein
MSTSTLNLMKTFIFGTRTPMTDALVFWSTVLTNRND